MWFYILMSLNANNIIKSSCNKGSPTFSIKSPSGCSASHLQKIFVTAEETNPVWCWQKINTCRGELLQPGNPRSFVWRAIIDQQVFINQLWYFLMASPHRRHVCPSAHCFLHWRSFVINSKPLSRDSLLLKTGHTSWGAARRKLIKTSSPISQSATRLPRWKPARWNNWCLFSPPSYSGIIQAFQPLSVDYCDPPSLWRLALEWKSRVFI